VVQLENFVKYFRRDQVMVISSAAIFKVNTCDMCTWAKHRVWPHFCLSPPTLCHTPSQLKQDSIDILERVRKFLGLPPDASFTQQLPHIEHASLTGIAFETCALRHIPLLDCSYRDKMGAYYAPYNEKLYTWVDATKAQADPNEPEFSPHFEDYKVTPCVADARKDYDGIVSREDEVERLREVRFCLFFPAHLNTYVFLHGVSLIHPRNPLGSCLFLWGRRFTTRRLGGSTCPTTRATCRLNNPDDRGLVSVPPPETPQMHTTEKGRAKCRL